MARTLRAPLLTATIALTLACGGGAPPCEPGTGRTTDGSTGDEARVSALDTGALDESTCDDTGLCSTDDAPNAALPDCTARNDAWPTVSEVVVVVLAMVVFAYTGDIKY